MASSQTDGGENNHCDLHRERSQGTNPTGRLVHQRREGARGGLEREEQRTGKREGGLEKSERGREKKRHKTCDLTKEGRYQRQVRPFICCLHWGLFLMDLMS